MLGLRTRRGEAGRAENTIQKFSANPAQKVLQPCPCPRLSGLSRGGYVTTGLPSLVCHSFALSLDIPSSQIKCNPDIVMGVTDQSTEAFVTKNIVSKNVILCF